MEQLSGLDASFIYVESATYHMNVAALAIFDPSTASDGYSYLKVRDLVADRIHLAPTFRRRLVRVPFDLDHPYWIDDPDFDLDDHVHHIAVPPPGGRAELMALFGRIISRPLNFDRPLWEMYVVEGLAKDIPGVPEGAVAVMFKFHHAAIDGISGVELLRVLSDPSADAGADLEPPDRWEPEPIPSDVELLAKALGHRVTDPIHAMELIPGALKSAVGVGKVLAKRVRGGGEHDEEHRERHIDLPHLPPMAPHTRMNGTLSSRRVFDGARVGFDEVKAARGLVDGATLNDVILTISAGGMRRYLEEKGELPDESLMAMVPVSVRRKEESGAMGNRVSIFRTSLGTNVKDPVERLAHIHAQTGYAKKVHGAVDSSVLMDATRFLPSSLLGVGTRLMSRLHIADRSRPIANCTISNVPGPREPVYSGGAKLVTEYGSGPIVDSIGLLIGILSYCDHLTLGITACARQMPDVERLARAIEEEMDALRP